METTLDDRFLACLRERLGAGVSYVEPPTPLSGGFDTIIHAFRLSGPVGDWSGPLVLRTMRRANRQFTPELATTPLSSHGHAIVLPGRLESDPVCGDRDLFCSRLAR